jgi:hypothetical protein
VRVAGRLTQAETAARLATEPTAEFRDGLRAVLMATIERDGIGRTAGANAPAPATPTSALAGKTRAIAQIRTPGPTRTRAAVLIGVAAGALALSGVSAASADSLPGDPLYHVKRSTERAQVALAGSDVSRGRLYLELAGGRSREARRVDQRFLGQVLADMDVHTRYGMSLLAVAAVHRHDAGALDNVLRFVGDQRDRLATLRPHDDAEQVRESLKLLDAVESRALALKAALAQGCTTTAMDYLGPSPTTC